MRIVVSLNKMLSRDFRADMLRVSWYLWIADPILIVLIIRKKAN